MTGDERLYTCMYCGELLTRDALWFYDNGNDTGRCYKPSCVKAHEKEQAKKFVSSYTPLDWDSLTKSIVL